MSNQNRLKYIYTISFSINVTSPNFFQLYLLVYIKILNLNKKRKKERKKSGQKKQLFALASEQKKKKNLQKVRFKIHERWLNISGYK